MLILIAVLYIIYKVGQWEGKSVLHKERIDKVEGFRDMVVELGAKVDLILQYTKPKALLESKSPISLTERGVEISDAMSANTLFEKYKDELQKRVDEKEPETAYDIQEKSFSVVKSDFSELLNDEELSNLKQVAFNKGIELDEIIQIFGIILRDYILNIRDIPISDVDKTKE